MSIISLPCARLLQLQCLALFVGVASVPQAAAQTLTWTPIATLWTPMNRIAAFTIGDTGYVVSGLAGGLLTNALLGYAPATDTWSNLADFDGWDRHSAVAFAVNDTGYVATGYSVTESLTDLHAYDPHTGTWVQRADLPATERYNAVGFSAGGLGFVATGLAPGNVSLDDLWAYDPATGQWTQRASLPGPARRGAMAFVLNDKAYICGGAGTAYLSDLWEYDPATDEWTERASMPAPRYEGACAISQGRAFVFTGVNNGLMFQMPVWMYDPGTDTWTNVGAAPSGRYESVGFTINDNAYLAFGYGVSASLPTAYGLSYDVSLGVAATPTDAGRGICAVLQGHTLSLTADRDIPGVDLQVFDPLGRLVLTDRGAITRHAHWSVPLHQLREGAYLVHYGTAQWSRTVRLVLSADGVVLGR